ncbi:hypothetical protein H6F86_14470 [Phormidium sp. FACHB-592]|uniref:Lipoprotein n=2 Tax=Cyanophyceae TaxID=3028117 RepID=A0ABV0KLN8_9CYAN|nr:hypothetical protein [Phormidium sp. FACHB-592]
MVTSTKMNLVRCPAIVGLLFLLSACNTSPSPTATLTPAPVASAQPQPKPSVASTPVVTANADPFPKADDKAISAANLARNASTVEDWALVSGKLQQAIALMKTVPAGSPKRAIAQKKLALYQQQLKTAQQQGKKLATNNTAEKARASQQSQPAAAVVTTAAPVITGIGSLNSENYSRIEFGMSPDEVRSLLGTPTREQGQAPTFSLTWESADKKTTVGISFYKNRVAGKSCVTSSSTMKCVTKT